MPLTIVERATGGTSASSGSTTGTGPQPGGSHGGKSRTDRRGYQVPTVEDRCLTGCCGSQSGPRTLAIRPVSDADLPALLALHDGVSEASFRFRFFSTARAIGHDYVHDMLLSRRGGTTALVALINGRVVALGTAERVAEGAAEVAMLVADAAQGHGVGTGLLHELLTVARRHEIHHFSADVLADNRVTRDMLLGAGFEAGAGIEWGVLHLELRDRQTR